MAQRNDGGDESLASLIFPKELLEEGITPGYKAYLDELTSLPVERLAKEPTFLNDQVCKL